MTYLFLRDLHTLTAIVAISGFALRGYWMLTGSDCLRHRITRIAPHVVDTIFLTSGVAMLMMMAVNPFLQNWLLAKFAGLIAYILLGMVALRRGPTLRIRTFALAGALFAFAYVVGVALSKSPASWLAKLA